VYNEELAEKILEVVNRSFPNSLPYSELKTSLPKFAEASDDEWLTAIDALNKEGFLAGSGLVRIGLGKLVKAAGLQITQVGRQRVTTDNFTAYNQSRGQRRLDGLLKIPDRGEFDKDLSRRLAEANDEYPLSLVMIDLDHFKEINDVFGHPAGDEVLRATASAVARVVNGKGESYRYGGEELAVVLPNFTLQEAMAVAERLRETIEAITVSRVERDISASLGVSSFPETTAKPEDLVQDADTAMYLSKTSGRNRVTSAKEITADSAARRKDITAKPTIPVQPEVRIRLKHASRQHFLIEIENHNDFEVLIERIAVEQDGIALMEPIRPQREGEWTIAAGRQLPHNWHPQPSPVDALARLNSNRGVLFTTAIEFVLTVLAKGSRSNPRQKIAVYVHATSGRLTQVAG
jgi:diguanylate cyclase (GGDEF)-like protein